MLRLAIDNTKLAPPKRAQHRVFIYSSSTPENLFYKVRDENGEQSSNYSYEITVDAEASDQAIKIACGESDISIRWRGLHKHVLFSGPQAEYLQLINKGHSPFPKP